MAEDTTALYFRLLNEVGILEQLSRALLQARLPAGMLVSHFGVLNHLVRVADGRTPLELARAFQVAKTTMTHTLAGLEKAGLVAMKPNARDGRSKRVWITDEGRAFRDRSIASLTPDVQRIAREFPSDRVERLLPELEGLRQIMDRQRSADGD
ncbi:MAG: MarR family transcriptional regulator [Rhodobacteraceae bacterium]|jgi:DNA-binding MarR family transcriptional regulator|nr:MarR family transcriptional regulator [Paracoccaceae bacterium]MBL4556515.1 MarR family transcriptional regulator [Paracoccaceae bacterium]HBG99268.1 MarR family transcriptional regulator [Paracoccaceae bacterium]